MQFQAIGTKWQIQPNLSSKLQKQILNRIEQFDKAYSRFRTDSLMYAMSEKAGEYHLPEDAKKLFDFYKKLYDISNGQVTPLIGNLMEQTGYNRNYSFDKKPLKHPSKWQEALQYKFPKLKIKKPTMLDLGAAGKGYLVDILGDILKNNKIENFVINAGGDILVGKAHAKILLEHPHEKTMAIGEMQIKNSSICGSGIHRRSWGDFHHVVDPEKLVSPKNTQAVWVKAQSAMLADGLATALFFVSPNKLKKHFEFEYAIIKDEKLYESSGFKAKWFKG